MLLERLRQHDALVEIPAALGPVGCGDARKQRHVAADHRANRIGNLDHNAYAVLKRTTVFVVAVIDERVEELRQQVAMRGMNLNHLETGLHRAPCGIAESVHNVVDLIHRKLARCRQVAKWQLARRNRLPTTQLGRHITGVGANGETTRRALASGMIELNRRHSTSVLHSLRNPPV